jgi:hypothetical protein
MFICNFLKNKKKVKKMNKLQSFFYNYPKNKYLNLESNDKGNY